MRTPFMLGLLLVPLLLTDLAAAPTDEDRARGAFGDRDYARGIALFSRLVKGSPDDPRADSWAMMVVRGLSLAGDREAAAKAGRAFLTRYPDSRFVEKVAFLAARALLGVGRGEEASALMAASLDRLRGPAARARIANGYVEAADRAFRGVPSLGPFDRGVAPDYARALRLYGLARRTEVSPAGRPAVFLRFAWAAVRTKGFDLALEVLDDLEDQADPEVLLLRAKALQGLLRPVAAREALTRLVETAPRSPRAPEALFLLGDASSLARLVSGYPDHRLAPEAALARGGLLAEDGEVDRAILAFDRAAADHAGTEYAAMAALAAAGALDDTGRLEEARERYGRFLARFPTSPDREAAREGLIDVWYRQGDALLADGDPDGAAKVWSRFRAAYPLSPFAPRTLFEEAEARSPAEALRLLGEVVARYPASEEAPGAALQAAELLSAIPGRMAEAVAALSRILSDYEDSGAAEKAESLLETMQTEELAVKLPRARRSDERPTLVVRTRNLKTLSGRVYRIDPSEYFENHGSFSNVDEVMVDVIAPDARFVHEAPDYEEFRSIEGRVDVPVEGEGVYIVVLEGERLRATGLLVVSDITVIVKEHPRGVLAFVQEARTGKPATGVTVLVRDDEGNLRETTTAHDGVGRIEFDNAYGDLAVLAVRGGSVALAGHGEGTRRIYGVETRIHIAPDRPVYRPGDTVRYRAIVRRGSGEYRVTPAGESIRILVTDGAGNRLHEQSGNLGEFGTVAGSFALPVDLPPRGYEIVARYRGEDHVTPFEVEAYRKPRLFLDVSPGRSVYIRGEEVRLTLSARYAFGLPVAGLPMAVRVRGVVRDGKPATLLKESVVAGADGRVEVRIPTLPGPDLTLRVRVRTRDATGRLYERTAEIPVPATAYRATLAASRSRLCPGEALRLDLRTADLLGNPAVAEGRIEVGRAPHGEEAPVYVRRGELPVAVGPDGKTSLVHRPKEPGRYRFRFRGEDRGGREVTASVRVEVVSEEGPRVLVRADRAEYEAGDSARISVTSPGRGVHALVTYEGEEIYGHRVVLLRDARNTIDVPVTDRFVPDVRLRVALAHDGRLYTGEDRIFVFESISVVAVPDRAEYGPGDLCRLVVRTTDASGAPVPAEVALSVVDEGIFRLHPDETPEIRAFFRLPPREDLVETGSSLDFRHEGLTWEIDEDLLAERERRSRPEARPEVLLEEEALEDPLGPGKAGVPAATPGGGGAYRGPAGEVPGGMRGAGGGRAAGEEALFATRRAFEDTACFRASVVTGPDGTATVEFRLPDDLTEWRVTARAASAGNAFGESRTRFLTSMDLVIRAALPRYLREGDRLIAAAGVVNGMERPAAAEVTLTPGLDAPEAVSGLTVPPGEERRVDWPIAGLAVGERPFRARVSTGGLAGDAEERTLATMPFGVPFRTGFSGVAAEPGARPLVLPEGCVPGTTKMTLHVTPSIMRAALDGIATLREYPHGCTEQTVNRFFPALTIARAIRRHGLEEGAALPELLAMAGAGVLRLTYLQNREGLWGWWGDGPTNPEMTAYALIALGEAKKAGIPFSRKVIERAEAALPALLARTVEPDAKVFLLLARSWAIRADFQTLAPAFADRRRLGLRGLAFLALAYEPFGRIAQAEILVREIEDRLRAGLPEDPETLGFVLAAVAGPEPSSSAFAQELAVALVKLRQGRGFGTTRQTGAAVLGLARVASVMGGPGGRARVRVVVNGEVALEREVPLIGAKGSVAGGALAVPVEGLRPGRNRVEVQSDEPFFYALTLSGVSREPPEARGPLGLVRTLSLVPPARLQEDDGGLVREGGRSRAPRVSALRVGEAVRVTLHVTNPARERYLVIEDPIPAGFEPVPGSERGPLSEAVRMEDRMVLFLTEVGERARVSYVYQGEMAGSVRVPPAVLYPMYRPVESARSSARALSVAGPGDEMDREATAGLDARGLKEAALSEQGAGRIGSAARHIEALLDRYDLQPEASLWARKTLAALRAELSDSAGVAECYERLLAESPTARLDLEDEVRRATAYRRLGRHGEAVDALARAAHVLFAKDIRMPEEVGGEGLHREILDRYPFSTYGEAVWRRLAERHATVFEAAVEAGGTGDPATLDVLREFPARYPTAAGAPNVAFRLARACLRSGRWKALEAEARRFGDRYPDGPLSDDADWFLAYSLFAQGRHEEAEAAARAFLAKNYRHEDGRSGPSKYEKNLLHLLAQSAHAEGRLEEAIALYRKVRDHSVDAREALRMLTERTLGISPITRASLEEAAEVIVTAKNVEEVLLSFYPIDLLIYFAVEKEVRSVAELNLDGILPATRRRVPIAGSGDRKIHRIAVPLHGLEPGVHLVVARAGDREGRGLVIRSDIEARIRRHHEGVRVLVTNRKTGSPVAGAFVKLANDSEIVGEGRTDARGIFERKGAHRGTLSAVAQKGASFALVSE